MRVDGVVISGKLEPYPDPRCGHTIYTTFTGRLNGDVIDGTFVSRHGEFGEKVKGTWKAERKHE